jgi:hypothetical protein
MPTHFAAILDERKIAWIAVWMLRFNVIGDIDRAVEV